MRKNRAGFIVLFMANMPWHCALGDSIHSNLQHMPIGHGQGGRAERAITQIMTPATYSACHTSRAMLRLRHGALPDITQRLLVRLRGGAKESPSVDDSEIVREQAADSDKKVYEAAVSGNSEEVERLLLLGANPDGHLDASGRSALMVASLFNFTDMVHLLLLHGADPDLQKPDGGTALMYASFEGYPEIVLKLLDNAANPNIQNHEGNTALDFALDTENPQDFDVQVCAELLRKLGALTRAELMGEVQDEALEEQEVHEAHEEQEVGEAHDGVLTQGGDLGGGPDPPLARGHDMPQET